MRTVFLKGLSFSCWGRARPHSPVSSPIIHTNAKAAPLQHRRAGLRRLSESAGRFRGSPKPRVPKAGTTPASDERRLQQPAQNSTLGWIFTCCPAESISNYVALERRVWSCQPCVPDDAGTEQHTKAPAELALRSEVCSLVEPKTPSHPGGQQGSPGAAGRVSGREAHRELQGRSVHCEGAAEEVGLETRPVQGNKVHAKCHRRMGTVRGGKDAGGSKWERRDTGLRGEPLRVHFTRAALVRLSWLPVTFGQASQPPWASSGFGSLSC